MLHAGEPMQPVQWIRQCEMPDLRKTKRLDRNVKLHGSSLVVKMQELMLYVSHAYQIIYLVIMMKTMMIVVGFDSMTWQDIMDFFTKIRGKRQDVCIEIAILLSILYSSTWSGLNQELTGMNNNRLGTTVG